MTGFGAPKAQPRETKKMHKVDEREKTTEADLAPLRTVVGGLRIEYLDGNCPVQAEGTVNGVPFVFKARGERWRLAIGEDPVAVSRGEKEGWYREADWGDKPFAAGWMPREEARAIIERCAADYMAADKGLDPAAYGLRAAHLRYADGSGEDRWIGQFTWVVAYDHLSEGRFQTRPQRHYRIYVNTPPGFPEHRDPWTWANRAVNDRPVLELREAFALAQDYDARCAAEASA